MQLSLPTVGTKAYSNKLLLDRIPLTLEKRGEVAKTAIAGSACFIGQLLEYCHPQNFLPAIHNTLTLTAPSRKRTEAVE